MKKTLMFLGLMVGMLTLGVSQSFATLPVFDGAISNAFEWDNINAPAGVAFRDGPVH